MASVVVPYDPAWPGMFEAERERLQEALGAWLEGGIHHVGSTAVRELAAKPIIDMLAGVRDLDEARAALPALEALGYEYKPHRPEAHLFHRPCYHLHLTEPGSDLWRERLTFRDALRRDPELRREYTEWKLEHAATGTEAYAASKWPFVARVLAEDGIELRADLRLLSPEELARRS